MRIAMLGHKRIPSREGGVEIVVEELARRMVQAGHEVTCYNRKGHHVSGKDFDQKVESDYNGIKIRSVWTIDKKGLAAVTSSLFASVCAAFGQYDVIHFHAEGSCAFLWIPKLFGKRCIVTIHGLDHRREKWGNFAKRYISQGERCAVKYADEIIVLSRGVQQYFADTYKRNTVFIPNGVNRPRKREAALIQDQYGLMKNSYILFLGRIVPEKGLRYLISAYQQVNTDKRLVIAGGSSDTDEFMNRLKKLANNDDRILFTGFVQGQVLDELYSNAYIYVLPSDLEGMPLSLLEAMSYGNCCLISNIEECTSVVQNMDSCDSYRAVVFKRGDTEDLKQKMQMLCDSPKEVSKYKEGAADYICEKYNWDEVVRQTLALYAGSRQDKK